MPAMWDRLRTAGAQERMDMASRRVNSGGGTEGGGLGSGYSYAIKGGPTPARPPREFMEAHYETAPPVQLPPPRNPRRNINRRDSSFRPTSSIYSQPSPQESSFPSNVASRNLQQRGRPGEDISPPSSPEPDYAIAPQKRKPIPRDVSPLGAEDRRMPQADTGRLSGGRSQTNIVEPQAGPRTNIPQMRRARRQASDLALRERASQDRLRPNHNQGPTHGEPPREPRHGDTRWDAMTGELTTNPNGRPAQVKPAEYAHGLGISQPTSPQQQKSPTAMTMFGERVRRMARPSGNAKNPKESATDPAANAFTSNRPGWKGASGRTTLVEPVRDDSKVAPLQLPVPRKSSKRLVSPSSEAHLNAQFSASTSRGQTPPVSPGVAETGARSSPRDTVRKVVPSLQASTAPAQSARPGEATSPQSYPSPPLSGNSLGAEAPSVAAKQLRQQAGNALNSLPSQSPTTSNFGDQSDVHPAIRRKPPPAHANKPNHGQQDSVSSVYSQQSSGAPPPPPPHNPHANTLSPNDPWVQPPSRFSVTTYATSAANTPRESLDEFNDPNRPPVPATPEMYRNSPQQYSQPKQDSVMDRKRPPRRGAPADEQNAGNTPVKISLGPYMSPPYGNNDSPASRDRKAAAAGGSGALGRALTMGERPLSTASSINKSLPLAPHETDARAGHDRVAQLNAELKTLANRRFNLTRSIKQMTELMPTDNLMASDVVLHKREMEKRKVEALRLELADVQREEYELGLKLHRAYKRLEKDAEFEPTTLWVRRVTG